jgi:hypothetical protein
LVEINTSVHNKAGGLDQKQLWAFPVDFITLTLLFSVKELSELYSLFYILVYMALSIMLIFNITYCINEILLTCSLYLSFEVIHNLL